MFLSARDAKPLLARSKQGRRLFNRSYRSGFRLVPAVRGGAERTPVRTPVRVSHPDAAAAPHPPDTEWSDRNKRYLPQSISFHEIPNGPGIYFLSNIETCPMREVDADDSAIEPSEIIDRNSSVPRLVKIGMADDLKKRIDRYLLYYPNGVYLYGFISENPRLEPRPQKRFKKDLRDSDDESEDYSDIKGPTRHTALLEIFFHNWLNKKGYRYRGGGVYQPEHETRKKHTHLNEWFILTKTQIDTIFSTKNHEWRKIRESFVKWVQTNKDSLEMTETTEKKITNNLTEIDFERFEFVETDGYLKTTWKPHRKGKSQFEFKEPISNSSKLPLLYYKRETDIVSELFPEDKSTRDVV